MERRAQKLSLQPPLTVFRLRVLSQVGGFWNTLDLEQALSRGLYTTTYFNCPQLRQLDSYNNIVFSIRIA